MTITIYESPRPKGRPRFTRQGHAYTPQDTRAYEMLIRRYVRESVKSPLRGEISVAIIFYMPIPKSWSKAKKQAAELLQIRPTTKPDIDNLVKAVLDAINGIAYEDDRQIVELVCAEYYGTVPRTEIVLKEKDNGI